MADKRSRRKFLAISAAVGTTVVAGCSGGGGNDTENDDDDDESEPTETTTAPTPTPEADTPTPEEETPTPEEEEETPTPEEEPSVNVDPWPMARYDLGQTGQNQTTTGPESKPTVDWEADLDGTPLTTPVLSNTGVYVATNSTLYAFSPVDGTELWTASLNGRPSTPAVGADRVYVPDGGLTAYDQATGQEDWNYEGRGTQGVGAATYHDGQIYLGSGLDNGEIEMYGVQSTGREQWVQRDISVGSGAAAPTNIAVDGDQLFVGTNAPGVLVLDTNSGAREDVVDVGPSPGIAMNDEIIAYGGREVGIWDRAEGTVRGTLGQRVDGVTRGTAPLLLNDQGTAAYGTSTGVNANLSGAMAISLENVFKEWDYGTGREMRYAPAAGGDMLYAPAKKNIYGIATFGAGSWTFDLGNEARTSPAVSSGRVFIGTTGPKLKALSE